MGFIEIKHIALFTVLFVLFLTIRVLKRSKSKGCFSFLFVGLVIFSIVSLFFSALGFLIHLTGKTYQAVLYGEFHTVRTVDYDSYISHDSDGGSTVMYTPIVEFKDNAGNLVRKKLDFSTGGEVMGKSYDILYIAEDGQILALGFTLFISFFGTIIFSFILGGLSLGIFLYAMHMPMDKYWLRLKQFSFGILIPVLMIAFEALLIYALFYGNQVSIFVTALLVLFIVVLGFGILGYFKMISNNGVPKMKRVSSNKWVSYWDD